MSALDRGTTTVRWCGGGLFVRAGSDGLLLDAPSGVLEFLRDELPSLRAVVLSGGRMASVGGLLPLLGELERVRPADVPLPVRVPLGEERGAAVAEVWAQYWPHAFPVLVDAARPGVPLDVGPIEVETLDVLAGEPRWSHGDVVRRPQLAVRVRTPDLVLAWVPGAAPGTVVERACRNVDLAVVEVGVLPWPRTEQRWRLSVDEAIRAAAGAEAAGIVGDDGVLVGSGAES